MNGTYSVPRKCACGKTHERRDDYWACRLGHEDSRGAQREARAPQPTPWWGKRKEAA